MPIDRTDPRVRQLLEELRKNIIPLLEEGHKPKDVVRIQRQRLRQAVQQIHFPKKEQKQSFSNRSKQDMTKGNNPNNEEITLEVENLTLEEIKEGIKKLREAGVSEEKLQEYTDLIFGRN